MQTGFPSETLGEPTFEEQEADHQPLLPVIDPLETQIEDDSEVWFTKPVTTQPPVDPNGKEQFTPDTTTTTSKSGSEMMKDMTDISQAVSSVTSQDPDGILWLNPQIWVDSQWDGIPFDPTRPKEELCAFLKPAHPLVVRGLRERFYEVNPFADNANPTVGEIDNWNIEVVRHIRKLFGITTPVIPDARLFLESRWASERKFTQHWDAAYPGDAGKAYGPCFENGNPVDTASGHCGESFFPNALDRGAAIANSPYNSNTTTYPELADYNARAAQASGISSSTADYPWAIKLGVVIANWICNEGNEGHAGPYIGTSGRERFGYSFWHAPGSDTSTYRGKWR